MRRNSGLKTAVITPGAVAMPSASPNRPVMLVTRAGRDSAALTSQRAALRALIIGMAW